MAIVELHADAGQELAASSYGLTDGYSPISSSVDARLLVAACRSSADAQIWLLTNFNLLTCLYCVNGELIMM
jgi:hypothetical protein